jgi:hypothetical protein
VPHLPVRVRDGAGVVGRWSSRAATSCLVCADLHRTSANPAWPAVAAQLREVIGVADRPTLLATAALALSQIQQIIAAVRSAGLIRQVRRPAHSRHPRRDIGSGRRLVDHHRPPLGAPSAVRDAGPGWWTGPARGPAPAGGPASASSLRRAWRRPRASRRAARRAASACRGSEAMTTAPASAATTDHRARLERQR